MYRQTDVKKPIILIVDDSFSNRMLLQKIFANDYQVELATNGQEGMDALHRLNTVAAVILDIQMPVMDGYEMLSQMRKEEALRDIPVIVDTASDDVDSQLRALDYGALDVLIKPINPIIALHRVRNIINRRESDKQAARNLMLEELLKQSEIDERTGIYNKHAFCRLTKELLQAHPEQKFVLLRWDIDRFKVYNDVFGVEAGDKLLRKIGDYYRRKAVANMTYGHWEADHFVTCLPEEFYDSHHIGQLISNLLYDPDVDFDFVTRLGVYRVDDPELDVALMCDRALLALRSIKDSYSERVAYYDDNMRAALIEEQRIIGEMDRALEQGQFVVYLQPQYNYDQRSLHGAEALVRWKHPELGLIPPIKFIPIFERNGFINKVDEYVWETVCKLQREWLDAGLNVVPVSVNISRRDIYNPHLSEQIIKLVSKYQLDPSLVRLEITESAYMENAEQLIKTVDRLRYAGFAVEMDDFGSGFSSLNTLKAVPVDMLKLDMKFLEDSAENTRGGSILTSVIRMAHWIDLPVIAEGVETKEQADYLNSIGCTLMQGYYFNKPMPVEEYLKLLSSSKKISRTDKRFTSSIEGAANFLSASTQATLLFNSFVGGAAIIEYDGVNVETLRQNDKFFEVLNTTREQYAGLQLHTLDRFDKKNKSNFLKTVCRAIDTGEEASCELCSLPVQEQDSEIWTHMSVRLLAQSGKRYILYMTIENITGRMKLSEQLSAIMDSVPGGILDFELSDHVKILYYNDITATMFGYTSEEYGKLYLQDPYQAIHPEDLPQLAEKVALAMERKVDMVEAMYRHRCAKGDWRWVRLTAHIVRRKGKRAYSSGILLDVDSEVRSRQIAIEQAQELERQRVSLRILYDTIPCGVMRFQTAEDIDGMTGLLDFNDASWQIFGYQSRTDYVEAIHGVSKLKDVHPDDLSLVKDNIARINEGKIGIRIEFEHRIIRPDASIRWINIIYQKVRYIEDEDVVQIVFWDVTDRKQEDLLRLCSTLFGLYDEVFELDVEQNTCFMRSSNKPDEKRIGRVVPFSKHLEVLLSRYAIPADHARIRAFYHNLRDDRNNAPETLEYRYIDEMGKLRWACATVLHISGSIYLSCNKDITDRKLGERSADEKLAANNATLKSTSCQQADYTPCELSDQALEAMDHSPAVIYMIDPDSHEMIYHNRVAIETYGKAEPWELCYQSIMGKDRECEDCPMRLLKQMGLPLPVRQLRQGKAIITQAHWVRWRGHKVALITDINAECLLDETGTFAALQRTNYLERYIATLFNLFDEIFEFDFAHDTFAPLASKCKAPSAARQGLTGIIDRWVDTYVVNEDRKAVHDFISKDHIRQAFRSKESPALEYGILLRDGMLRRVRSTIMPLDMNRILYCNNDITLEKKADQLRREMLVLKAQAEAHDRYRIVVEQTGTAVIDMNYDTGAFSSSDAYQKYEISRHDQSMMLDNKGDRRLVHKDDQAALETFFAAAKNGDRHSEAVLRVKMTDGTYRWTRMAGTYLYDKQGVLRRAIGTFTDIDEEMRSKLALEKLSDRMQRIIANIPTGVAIVEVKEQLIPIYVSEKACHMFGYTMDEYELRIANGEAIHYTPEQSRLPKDALEKMLSGQPLVIQKLHARRKDGSRFWLRAFCSASKNTQGVPLCYAVLLDISEEVALEQKTAWQAEKYRILSESVDMITFDYSPKEDVMRLSLPVPGKGCKLDVIEHYLENVHNSDRIPTEMKESFINALRSASNNAMQGTYDFQSDYGKNGLCWYRAKYISLARDDGEVYRIVGRLDDINDIIMEQDQLRQEAQLDELTGIYNKSYATVEINNALKNRNKDSLDAVLFLDIDNFKSINDTYGHMEADQALKQIGETLNRLFRKGDIVARFGGDEFIIYIKSIGTLASVKAKAKEVMKALNAIVLGNQMPVQCSIGITMVNEADTDYEAVLKRADTALYQAKNKGKNQYSILEDA